VTNSLTITSATPKGDRICVMCGTDKMDSKRKKILCCKETEPVDEGEVGEVSNCPVLNVAASAIAILI
jgi:hypothetical protein